MNRRLLVVGLLTPILMSACVIDTRHRDTVIGPERTIDLPLPEHAILDLRIPVGDVDIEGVAGDRLQAEMVILCPDVDSRCARRLADVRFVTSVEGDHVIVRTSHDSSMKYRDADVRTRIQVPSVHAVHVNMTAGDLNISRLSGCLTVDMGAGDIDVELPQEQVASVKLDAGIGDASLAVDGRHRSAPRSFLIGAELDWHQGSGHCRVDVDLQAGDIFVELTEG